MRKPNDTWVIYRMTVRGKIPGGNAVCEQGEWEAMELSNPGYHALIQSGIATEEEAEKLARGSSGENFGRRGRKV
jgi:hypothetical protein